MTGELLTIADGPLEVELLPAVGGRLHRLRAFGHDLLRTPRALTEHTREPFLWGGFVMAPWCNRLAIEPTVVGDEVVRLRSNFPDGTAIHGQVYAVPWSAQEDGTLSVRGGGDAWPWPYESTLRASVVGPVLTFQLTLTNRAATAMPGGLGLHPWFRRPMIVRIAASHVVASNSDPLAALEPVAGAFDLREPRAMPEDLDAAWLDPDDPAVELRWPELGISATIRAHHTGGICVVAASPGWFDAIAVEPQTHLPQGLRRHLRGEAGGLRLLAPGETMRLSIEMTFGPSTTARR